MANAALKIEKHGNVWMLVRRNGEGIVSVLKSCRTERSALDALSRLA